MKRFALLILASSGVATAGLAQDISYGGLSLSYGAYSDGSGNDLSLTTLSGELGLQFGAFDANIAASRSELSEDSMPDSLSLRLATIGVGYTFSDTLRADISTSDATLSMGLPAIDLGLTEVGFAYDNGTYFGRVSYAKTNDDTLDIDNLWGLHFGYDAGNGLSASLSAHWINEPFDVVDRPVLILTTEYDAGQWEVALDAVTAELAGENLRLVAFSGSYDFNDQWTAYAGISDADLAGLGINSVMIGGKYHLNDTTSLYADVSRLSADGIADDVTGVNFGVSFDLGDKRASRETTIDRLETISSTLSGMSF